MKYIKMFDRLKNCFSFNLYMGIYIVILAIYVGTTVPQMIGEWDDYMLPSISVINEGNFGVGRDDIEMAKVYFPEYRDQIEHCILSGYYDHNGEQMSWYFPTYSVACIPLILLFKFLKISAVYAFGFTNLFVLAFSLLYIYRNLKLDTDKKWLLIVLLSINPIIFYLSWLSAEVFIYSSIMLGVMHWVKKEYRRAALFISLASTLNPVILGIGFVMIPEYLLYLVQDCSDKSLRGCMKHYISHWKKVITYALCYVIGLIPLGYNMYQTGYINLTASLPTFISDTPFGKIERFLAYMFDLNFGFLPYYNFVFVLSFILFGIAFVSRKWKYMGMMLAFYLTMFLYSIMIHINCGMSGIARYNAWNAVILIFAVIAVGKDILKDKIWFQHIFKGVVLGTIISNIVIIYVYGPMRADDTNYVTMNPIAAKILDIAPQFYSPLPSTFNSRVNNIDGGYTIEMPIIYANADYEIKKIYAAEKDKEILAKVINRWMISESDYEWYIDRLSLLDGVPEHNTLGRYISIPAQYSIPIIPSYNMNEIITFSGEQRTAEPYVIEGLSGNEHQFSWTDGNSFKMQFWIRNIDTQGAHAIFHIEDIFIDSQMVKVLANGVIVYQETLTEETSIEFDFEVPQDGIVMFEVLLPNAARPSDIGFSEDNRKLGLALIDMQISKQY